MRISDWSADVCSSDLQHRDQRLAHFQFGDDSGDIDAGIGAKCFGGGFDRLLLTRREGAQRVLDAVTKLAGDIFGDIDRILGDEINAHAFGRSEEHTSELKSLMRISYAVFCLKKKKKTHTQKTTQHNTKQ